jgi:hypothetical protein
MILKYKVIKILTFPSFTSWWDLRSGKSSIIVLEQTLQVTQHLSSDFIDQVSGSDNGSVHRNTYPSSCMLELEMGWGLPIVAQPCYRESENRDQEKEKIEQGHQTKTGFQDS